MTTGGGGWCELSFLQYCFGGSWWLVSCSLVGLKDVSCSLIDSVKIFYKDIACPFLSCSWLCWKYFFRHRWQKKVSTELDNLCGYGGTDWQSMWKNWLLCWAESVLWKGDNIGVLVALVNSIQIKDFFLSLLQVRILFFFFLSVSPANAILFAGVFTSKVICLLLCIFFPKRLIPYRQSFFSGRTWWNRVPTSLCGNGKKLQTLSTHLPLTLSLSLAYGAWKGLK